MGKWSEKLTLRFVREYIKHQCLWDTRIELNKNKTARQTAYGQIKEAMGISGFEVHGVITKIKNLRSTYCQELKKIAKSKKHGVPYKPTLKWFYELHQVLRLVRVTADSPPSTPTNEKLPQVPKSEPAEEESVSKVETMCKPAVKRKRIQPVQPVVTQVKRTNSFTNRSTEENEFDLFGRHIALQLKAMDLKVALQAQQRIQTCLYQFRLQNLTQGESAEVHINASAPIPVAYKIFEHSPHAYDIKQVSPTSDDSAEYSESVENDVLCTDTNNSELAHD